MLSLLPLWEAETSGVAVKYTRGKAHELAVSSMRLFSALICLRASALQGTLQPCRSPQSCRKGQGSCGSWSKIVLQHVGSDAHEQHDRQPQAFDLKQHKRVMIYKMLEFSGTVHGHWTLFGFLLLAQAASQWLGFVMALYISGHEHWTCMRWFIVKE